MRSGRTSHASGFTLIELLVVVALIGILASLCVSHLIRAKNAANEASAVGTLRAIVTGQSAFAIACGGGAYSTSLRELVDNNYLNPDADVTPKSGFLFSLLTNVGQAGSTDCHGNATRTAYYMQATPASSMSGRRAFGTNASGTIWQNASGVAPVEPFGSDGAETLREH